ncbi:uncharacterized protein LOC111377785 [Olea europaea var. sylvestris]|uniref:uncharacterized protein LOC111377785 n=1 Tax=Olea europaea var. sylvestris TaxID=158386 RepID=UPI000C1D3189|nr:uncharacterized protein LOC111377785 [Olea europaea var. sylvestris]
MTTLHDLAPDSKRQTNDRKLQQRTHRSAAIMKLFFRPKQKFIPNSSTSSCASNPAIDSRDTPPIESYDPNVRDDVRMSYLEKGPCQPYGHNFSRRPMENDNRSRCKEIEDALFNNATENDQMTSPTIQKDLVNCCVVETTRAIINEIGNSLLSVLVDEARDNFTKKKMAVVLRFVDKSGQDAIDIMFSTHELSISSLRGQGYDGASNMSDEFNGLKALILRENPHAINCMLGDFFNVLAIIVNLVGASCKRVDAFRISYHSNILEKLNIEELTGESGQFQEARPGDTRDDFSQALQKKNQDIQNAIGLLNLSFDKNKLLRLAQFYHLDFNREEFLLLRPHLDKFFMLVRMDETFFNLNSISCAAHLGFDLTVATASVERVFSDMNLIKSNLCNKMGDDWLNDNLVVYVEKCKSLNELSLHSTKKNQEPKYE